MQIALAFMAICLPGLAWWLWLGDHQQDGGEALARIFAVSAGFITLLGLAFYTVRLSFTPLMIGILLSICIGLVLAGLLHSWKTAFNKTWLIALIVLGVFVFWRLWQARELISPNWVDSQHHVLIIVRSSKMAACPARLSLICPAFLIIIFPFTWSLPCFQYSVGLARSKACCSWPGDERLCWAFVYALAKAIGKIGASVCWLLFLSRCDQDARYYLVGVAYTLLIG